MNKEDSLLEKDLCYQILGGAMEVLREIGHGLHEKPYENALVLALEDECFHVSQQQVYPILFKGRNVGEYIPDIVVENRVIVDPKVIDRITNHERGQMLNYLKITGSQGRINHQLQVRQAAMGASSELIILSKAKR